MSDRFCGCITIGGRLKRAQVDPLLQALASVGASLEWGESMFEPADTDELLLALEDRRLWLCGDQARYGEFPELEEACRELGLAYSRHSEGKYEYDPEIVEWRPGMAEPLVRHGSNNDNEAVYVPLRQVKEALDCLEAGSLAQGIKLLRALCPEIPELPQFEII